MTQGLDVERKRRVRAAIQSFLNDRLHVRLDKLAQDDPKRKALIYQFQSDVWLEDAARRVHQIQAVTHSLKAIHPEARGTNLYVSPSDLFKLDVVGSHALKEDFADDVVGNAAALDVYKLLKLEVDGRSLLEWFSVGDAAAVHALCDDLDRAHNWRLAFAGLVDQRDAMVSSHTKAKQMYWLLGDYTSSDATDDSDYHLLAPLYPTSLVHEVHGVIQEDRFGDATKAARAARRENKAHDGVLRIYPELGVQKLGGTKPQNISQLNTERGGVNYLLGSLPPQWRSQGVRQPWGLTSIFDRMLIQQPGVASIVHAFSRFLESAPPPNLHTRNRVDVYVASLIDEVVLLATRLQQSWPVGWTTDSRCVLVHEEQLWLDPARAEYDGDFCDEWLAMEWSEKIGSRFGNWLNAQLQKKLPVGEVEQRHWRKELLSDEEDDGWAQQLNALRRQQRSRETSTQGERS